MNIRLVKSKPFDENEHSRDTLGRFARVRSIKWDAEGHGGTPNQVDIDYFGFVKEMKPEEFRALVPKGNWNKDTIEFIKEAAAKGEAVAPPFLVVDWDDTNKQWLVYDHEGRSRADAASEISPNSSIPIHILPRGMRARSITDEMRNAPFVPQKTGKAKPSKDEEELEEPEIQKIPLSGRKYNPYWYVQPRDSGKWSNVSIKRDSKGHLNSWGTGETFVSLDMNNVDKRYVEKAFGMATENLAEFMGETFKSSLHKNSIVSMSSRYFPSLMDNAMVTVVRMECKSPQLSTTLRVSEYLDGTPPKFEISYMELPYNDQAQGAGKDALRKCVALADQIGADRISLLANIDVGGYAWARYGFVPTPKAWKELSVAIRKSLMKVDFKGNPEASEIIGHVKTLTAPNSDPRNIRAVAGLVVPVSHPVLGDTKLGWSLLRNTNWESEAYLNDKETLAHIQATCRKEESFDYEDWERLVSTTAPRQVIKAASDDRGAFFMSSNTGRRDDLIHKYMLPAGSFVADQVAVRQLMSIGMSRADARRFVGLQRGYGG